MNRRTNRGSRTAELDEWEKWSWQLLKEYNELTGIEIPYPKIEFRTDNFDRAYYIAFSDPLELTNANKWKEIERKNAWLKNDPTDSDSS